MSDPENPTIYVVVKSEHTDAFAELKTEQMDEAVQKMTERYPLASHHDVFRAALKSLDIRGSLDADIPFILTERYQDKAIFAVPVMDFDAKTRITG